MSRLQKIILYIIGGLLLAGLIYYFINKYGLTKEHVKFFIQQNGFILLFALVAIAVIYYFVKKKLDEKNKKTTEIFKEIVDVDPAFETWKEGFFLKTNIPYTVYHEEGKEKIEPADQRDFSVIESHHFDQKNTGIPHSKIIFRTRLGTMSGLNCTIIRRDKGLDWIKRNIFYHITTRTNKFTFKIDETNYPLATPQGIDQDLETYRINKIEQEGFSEKELQYIDRLKSQRINRQPQDQQQYPEMTEEQKQINEDAVRLHNIAQAQRIAKGGNYAR